MTCQPPRDAWEVPWLFKRSIPTDGATFNALNLVVACGEKVEMECLTQISLLHCIHAGCWRAKEFSALEEAGAMAKWEG